jgi:hypothetical protein
LPASHDNDITPQPTSLSSAIASKTRQRHHATTNVASTVPSPVRLGSDITPRPMSPLQHHHQQDSAVTSRHGQHCLSNGNASKTRQRHRAMANIASAMPSPARLSSDITPDQCHLDSAISNQSRQWHHVTTNVASVVPSPARLSSDITPQPTSPQ